MTAKARVDPGLPSDAIFMPFWLGEADANPPADVALDPRSKIPEDKYCAHRLELLQ